LIIGAEAHLQHCQHPTQHAVNRDLLHDKHVVRDERERRAC
jgi:hypothetical protein